MQTPDDIKKGLQCCWSEFLDLKTCSGCPYNGMPYKPIDCEEKLGQDALAYIQQLEAELAQSNQEKKAMLADLSDRCCYCRFIAQKSDDSPCVDCFKNIGPYPWSPMVRTKFEWRGIQTANTREATP